MFLEVQGSNSWKYADLIFSGSRVALDGNSLVPSCHCCLKFRFVWESESASVIIVEKHNKVSVSTSTEQKKNNKQH